MVALVTTVEKEEWRFLRSSFSDTDGVRLFVPRVGIPDVVGMKLRLLMSRMDVIICDTWASASSASFSGSAIVDV